VKKHNARSTSKTLAPPPGKHPRRGHARPRRVSLIRYLLLAGLLAAGVNVFAASPLDLDIAVKSLVGAQAPRMVDDVLILSYAPEHPVRFVGVRFSHESWKVLHSYSVNEHKVFVLDYPIPEGIREIRYRIVVDGLWMADPANPLVESDTMGEEFSVFTLDKEPYRPTVNPRRERDGEITFTFRGASGRRVSIAGDFNNWDPFMDYLAEKAPGTYSITFRMLAGRHWYFFFSEGQRIIDMANPETGFDPDGNTVSSFAL
jgi:hypothetical protein